jgi:SAM-dependent methyltransferase
MRSLLGRSRMGTASLSDRVSFVRPAIRKSSPNCRTASADLFESGTMGGCAGGTSAPARTSAPTPREEGASTESTVCHSRSRFAARCTGAVSTGAQPAARCEGLNFGCGDGKFLNRLQDRGWDTYGIEPSADVAFLRHRRLKSPPQDGSFDFIVLHHVLEHVRTPLELLKQLALTLREGGVMFLSTPRLDTLPHHRDLPYCIDGRWHILCFTERCLSGLLARAGVQVTARLELPELDRVQSDGKQVRLRIVATRTASPPPLPAAPLAPALAALRQYGMASTVTLPLVCCGFFPCACVRHSSVASGEPRLRKFVSAGDVELFFK